jgi:hypothetical protein
MDIFGGGSSRRCGRRGFFVMIDCKAVQWSEQKIHRLLFVRIAKCAGCRRGNLQIRGGCKSPAVFAPENICNVKITYSSLSLNFPNSSVIVFFYGKNTCNFSM